MIRKKLTPEQEERLTDFFWGSLVLSDDENAAMEHMRPMSQGMFNRIADKLLAAASIYGYEQLCGDFPGFVTVYEMKGREETVSAKI